MTKQTQSVSKLTAAFIRIMVADTERQVQLGAFANMQKEIKEARSKRYSDAFAMAKDVGCLADYEVASDAAKAAIKASRDKIDRDVSNAISQIKRFWRTILLAVETAGRVDVTVRSVHYVITDKADIIRHFETLNSLREVSEAVQGSGAVGDAVLVKKLTLLSQKVKGSDPAQANAALDAALAFFLTGKAPKKAKPAENGKVTAKSRKPQRASKPPAQQQA